jgi:hypothetical protein
MKRRISLIFAITFLAIASQAQQTITTAGGTSFGLRGGINFQNINGKDENGNKLKNDLLIGFNVGVNAEIPVAPQFYFQPGLLFSVKGAKSNEKVLDETVNAKVRISYLELPLNFLFKPLLGTGHLLLGFGPYVALGIGGKAKYDVGGSSRTANIKFKNDVKVTDADDVVYIKPLDAGANLLVGYEFSNKVSMQLNTQLGLTKINPSYEGSSNDKTSAKNTGFGLSLGYRF